MLVKLGMYSLYTFIVVIILVNLLVIVAGICNYTDAIQEETEN
jgi:hypothetical protein